MPSLARTTVQPKHSAVAGAALFLGALVLVSLQGDAAALSPVRGAAAVVAAPVAETGTGFFQRVHDAGSVLFRSSELIDENERLREEVAELRVQSALASQQLEAAATAALLTPRHADLAPSLMGVPVIGPAMDEGRHRLWIAAGLAIGIEPGQAVLGPHGVIGTVREVHNSQSLIQLLTDEESKWGGEVGSPRELGVVQGTGKPGALEFRPEKTAARIADGATVLTSGAKGSLLPTGLVLGRVIETRVDKRGERVAILEPADSIAELRYVYVLGSGQFAWDPPAGGAR